MFERWQFFEKLLKKRAEKCEQIFEVKKQNLPLVLPTWNQILIADTAIWNIYFSNATHCNCYRFVHFIGIVLKNVHAAHDVWNLSPTLANSKHPSFKFETSDNFGNDLYASCGPRKSFPYLEAIYGSIETRIIQQGKSIMSTYYVKITFKS